MTIKHSTLPVIVVQYETETPEEITSKLEKYNVIAWHDGTTVWWLCNDSAREFDRGEFIAVPDVNNIDGVIYG